MMRRLKQSSSLTGGNAAPVSKWTGTSGGIFDDFASYKSLRIIAAIAIRQLDEIRIALTILAIPLHAHLARLVPDGHIDQDAYASKCAESQPQQYHER